MCLKTRLITPRAKLFELIKSHPTLPDPPLYLKIKFNHERGGALI
jgi:hypothetical protein